MDINEALASYLNQPAFQRLTAGWQEKYHRLGHLGGTLVIKDLTGEEKRSIGLLLGMDLSTGELRITYAKFAKILSKTRFEGADFVEVLHLINGDKIYTRHELLTMKTNREQMFKQRIKDQYEGSFASSWLKDFFEHDGAYLRYVHEDEKTYEQIISHVTNALNHLPVWEHREELLAVFSEKQTQDPHYFDHGLALELLLKGIHYLLVNDNQLNATDTLSVAGIIRDELSNYCPICHLEPSGSYPAWQAFSQVYEPWNMNLMNIRQVHDKFKTRPVFIVENPAVFSCLCEFLKQKQIDAGLVCGNGQINRCTYTLLDKLNESKCALYYAGDFDPEGLLIADKLKWRYPDLILWCMDEDHFRKVSISQNLLSERRLKMLSTIQAPALMPLAEIINKEKMLGYQEGLIEEYKKQIARFSKGGK